MQRVIYTLRVLRHVYNCDLPAQIYHFPSEKLNSDNPQLEELKALGAEMVEAEGTHRDGAKRKSYHLKGLAITQSPFQEVLFLDSDNIPTRDPTYVFDAPAYKRLGAMFFPVSFCRFCRPSHTVPTLNSALCAPFLRITGRLVRRTRSGRSWASSAATSGRWRLGRSLSTRLDT